jgi:hypothetical protein
MALRDQPYLPLYVQDVLTDEKLIECSAEAHGVYFRLLCILHKQETYGLLCLKQKWKQNGSKFSNFASLLRNQMPFTQKQIEQSLIELSDEGVIQITDDSLSQKRMVRDGQISSIRSDIGRKGGIVSMKQYGIDGFLYWMSDGGEINKVGISKNPQNRLYRLRCDLNIKKLRIESAIGIVDMGKCEDMILEIFGEFIEREWVKLSYQDTKEKFALLEAKVEANYEAKVEAKFKNNSKNEANEANEANDEANTSTPKSVDINDCESYNNNHKEKFALLEANSEYEDEYKDGSKEKKEKKEKEGMGEKVKKEKFDLSFLEDDFKTPFIEWMEYKRQRNETYKTQKSFEACYNRLKKLSRFDSENASLIVEQSMANNWAGLFELKISNNGKSGNNNNSQSGVSEDYKRNILERLLAPGSTEQMS